MSYVVGSQLVECQHDGCMSRTNNCHPVCPIHATCWYTNTFCLSLCQICTCMLVTTLDVNAHNIQRIQAVNNLFKWIAILSSYVRHKKLPFNINIELRCLTRRSYSDISSEEWGNLLQLFIMHGTMSQFLPDGRSRFMASFPSCGLHDLSNIFQMRSPQDINLCWNPKWEVPRSFRFRVGYPIRMNSPRIPPPQSSHVQFQSIEADPNQCLPRIWYSGDNVPLVNYEENLSEIESQTVNRNNRDSSETKAYSCSFRFSPHNNQDSGCLKHDVPESGEFNPKRRKSETTIDTSIQGPSSSIDDPCIHYDGWRHLPQNVTVLQNDLDEIIGFKQVSGEIHVKDVDMKILDGKFFFRYKAVEMSDTAKTARTVTSCRTALNNLTFIFPHFGMSKDTETKSKYPTSKFRYQALELGHINCGMWSKERYRAWLDTGKLDIIEIPVFMISLQNEGLSGLKQCLLEPVLKSNVANKQLEVDSKLLKQNLLILDYDSRNNLWDILSMLCLNEYVLSCMGELQSMRMSDKANTATQAVSEVIHAGLYQMAYLARQAIIKFFAARKALRDEAVKDINLSDLNIAKLVESTPFCQFLFPETIVEELMRESKSYSGPSGTMFERQVRTEPVHTPPGNRGRGHAKYRGKGKTRRNVQRK